MKKLLLIALLIVGCVFAQKLETFQSSTHKIQPPNIYVPKLWLDKKSPKIEISSHYYIEILLEPSDEGSVLIIQLRSSDDSHTIDANYGAVYIALPENLNASSNQIKVNYLDSSLNHIDGYEFSLTVKDILLEIMESLMPGVPGTPISTSEIAKALFKSADVGSIEEVDIEGTLFTTDSGYTMHTQIWNPIQESGWKRVEADVLEVSVPLSSGVSESQSIIEENGLGLFLYAKPSCVTANIGILIEQLKHLSTKETKKNIDTVTDIDGNIYKVIEFGNLTWLEKLLKVTHYKNGEVIPHININKWGNLLSGTYDISTTIRECPPNPVEDGNIYNWHAIIDSRGICPEGYHVPTDKDWLTVIDHRNKSNGSKLSKRKDNNYLEDHYYAMGFGNLWSSTPESSLNSSSLYKLYYGENCRSIIIDNGGYNILCTKDD